MNRNSRRYHKTNEFPNEAFVQQANEVYFTEQGFQIEHGGYSDLVCRDVKRGQKWIIEVKGQTSAVRLDFRTGLGQLLQDMQDPKALYDLAVPNIPAFVEQCRRVSDWVRQTLYLHWLLIESDGEVTMIPADEAFT
jgi:hypothetical protein